VAVWLLFKRADALYTLVHESDLATFSTHPDLDRYCVTRRQGSDFEAVTVECFHTIQDGVAAMVSAAERDAASQYSG
jgi:hypothetical protein